jgi:hypothetical protein
MPSGPLPDKVAAAVITRVAAESKIVLGPKDPSLVIHLLVRIGIEEAVKALMEDTEVRQREAQAYFEKLRTQFAAALDSDSTNIAMKIRKAVQEDLDRASSSTTVLVQNVAEAYSRPARLRWVIVGMGLAIVLIGFGIGIGRSFF